MKKTDKANIEVVTRGLSDEEKRCLKCAINVINRRRIRANKPRIRHKMKLG